MSKETKFTKGEWLIEYGNLVVIGGVRFEFESKHDAHLIKTAPKLYDEIADEIKFLTKLMTDNFTVNCSQSWEICERIDSLNEALAEARGGD